MLDVAERTLEAKAQDWVAALDRALAAGDATAVGRLFVEDSHWRNLSGISWPLRTYSGRDRLARELTASAAEHGAGGFALDPATLAPRESAVAGRAVVEAAFRFRTRNGPGQGVVRLVDDDGDLRAWTFSSLLDIDRIVAERKAAAQSGPVSHSRDFAEPTWAERRAAEAAFEGREPDVLVVGGGHAGLSAAAEIQRLGRSVLIVDRETRIGDNWRLRYDGLKLHNKTPVNHLRYLPFPPTSPDYLPKEKVASWLEAYVEGLDLNFWTETAFEGADYDTATESWKAKVRRADGTRRVLRPKHIVLATSVSGTPNIPTIPTLDRYEGEVVHSSAFTDGAPWRDRPVLVIGTGTSAHDIAQELHADGARVTMMQRSPTLVVNVDPSAQIYDQLYLDDGPPLEVRDLLNASMPYPVTREVHKIVTARVKALDKPLLDRLEAVGFRLDFGEDGTGWPLKFRTRGGGYYFNVGCSDLIADGAIRLIQAADVDGFTPRGLRLDTGEEIAADLVVLGTGFKNQNHVVQELFGPEVGARVGPIWGLDPEYHELRKMWTRTGQPGLWFTGGAFSMCRIYSRFLALQIDAIEDGRLEKQE